MALGQNSREVLLGLWEKSTESNLRGWVINAMQVAWLASSGGHFSDRPYQL